MASLPDTSKNPKLERYNSYIRRVNSTKLLAASSKLLFRVTLLVALVLILFFTLNYPPISDQITTTNNIDDHHHHPHRILTTQKKFSSKKHVIKMPRNGDVPFTHANVSLAYRDFGYKPTTDLATGLRKFVKWYVSYYGIESRVKRENDITAASNE